MSDKAGIQWTDATWNPTRGCSRVSPGCVNCYAERTAMRQIHDGYKGLVHIANGHPAWTGKVVMAPERTLLAPLRWRKPRHIFVNSMSDLFHESLPDEAIDCVFAVMALCPQHTFQVLTKRPERMLNYLTERPVELFPHDRIMRIMKRDHGIDAAALRWPLPNVWLGVSVEDQKYADERIPLLLQTPATVRFVSYEPALGPVDFRREWLGLRELMACQKCGEEFGEGEPCPNGCMAQGDPIGPCDDVSLDWVIVGGESGPGARPFDIAWARKTVEECRAAGVACFVKQLGSNPRTNAIPGYDDAMQRLEFKDRKGGDMSEWPKDLRIREFPQPAVMGAAR